MRKSWIAALGLIATSAAAQVADTPVMRTVQVTGSGRATTPPDLATIDFWVAGEGKTPDEATRALSARNDAVVQGLGALLGARTAITGGSVIVIETRGPQCNGPNSYGNQPRLSEGECAVTGFIATLQGTIRTDAVARAATAVGLASRLGARDARLQGFSLSSQHDARNRAVAAALEDARQRAAAIAAGSHAKLGPVVTVRDQAGDSSDIIVSARRMDPVPPAPPPPPVQINLTPAPIETRADVYVTYELLP